MHVICLGLYKELEIVAKIWIALEACGLDNLMLLFDVPTSRSRWTEILILACLYDDLM
jgi:hypothetical protein